MSLMTRNAPSTVIGGIPRVNLMPRSEIERRDRAATIRGWGWGIVATLLLIVLLIAGALYLNWAAQQRLTAEQNRTNVLLAELSSLSEVSAALNAQSQLETFRADAMASDLEWAPVYSTLTSALPDDVTLTGFDLTVGPAPVADVDVTLQEGLDGGLTFTSPNVIDMAELIRDYRALPGVINADGWQVASDNASDAGSADYTYELTIEFDQSLYTGAYAEGEN